MNVHGPSPSPTSVCLAGATGWAGSEPARSMTHVPPRFGEQRPPLRRWRVAPHPKGIYASGVRRSLDYLRDISKTSPRRF